MPKPKQPEITLKELAELIGEIGLYPDYKGELFTLVRILEADKKYGRPMLLVEPIAGKGRQGVPVLRVISRLKAIAGLRWQAGLIFHWQYRHIP